MSSLEFARAARRLGDAARHGGFEVPAFRSPPRAMGGGRSIRRRSDGSATVSIPLRGRPMAAVLADMIDGVVATNRLDASEAGTLRDVLWASSVDLLTVEAEGPSTVAA